MDQTPQDRFEILHFLAGAAAGGKQFTESAQTALELAAKYVGLEAASVIFWGSDNTVTSTLTYAMTPEIQRLLNELEEDVFTSLRKNRKLSTAYMSFDTEITTHSFTLPLKYQNNSFGAIIGIQTGKRSMIAEELFLETISGFLALWYSASSSTAGSMPSAEILDQERLKAVLETAVTVNHEVNNPLQAIIGNVQLLLMKHQDELSPDLKEKLKAIEDSAMKINDVTKKLMSLTSPKTVDYSNGTKMIDLNDGDGDSEE